MEELRFLNSQGDFLLTDAQRCPEAYFPLVNEGGMMSSITPLLAGDCKTGQNTFLLAPASAETLQESTATRNFWVCIEGKAPWSVTGKSAAQRADARESSTLAGGLLWQKLTRESAKGLRAETLSFVPAGKDRVEVMQVSLTNTGKSPVTFSPVAAIPLYGRSADNIRDHRHVTSLLHRVELTKFGVNLHPTLTFDERGHQRGEVTYRVWGAAEDGMENSAPAGFLPLVRDFVGNGSYDWPQALTEPEGVTLLHEGDTAQGGEVVAALFFPEATLAPQETRRYQIVLAVDDDPAPYLTAAAVETHLERTKAWWQKAASQRFRTGDAAFDAWMRWVGIQPLLRRICGCSFLPHHDYGRGGRGWRDLWQDSLALLLTDPAATRNDLLCYFAGVRTDGTNATIIGTKPGEFKADRNNIPRVWMDHGFWPLLTVNLYLDETGDDGFLLEEQPYFADTLAFRGEGGPRSECGVPHSGTVLEHLLVQALTALFDVGEHGHMRLRGADWNDGLDMARTRGESVAFTAAYAGNFDTLASLLRRLEQAGHKTLRVLKPLTILLDADCGTPEQILYSYCRAANVTDEKVEVSVSGLAERMQAMADIIKSHIRENEWIGDGEGRHWFNSYYDDSGKAVEGIQNDRVRMMLTGQVFCLLSGTADDSHAREIVQAADQYLFDASRGGYCLNTDFEEVKLDMGRMFGFAYGHKENGAVFCHMAVMYAYALYSRGFAKEGWKVLENLYRQSNRFSASRILPGVPEYFDDRGRGMYPYLTGAGSWWLLTLQTQAFGVRGRAGDLVLAPKLTAGQFGAEGTAEILCASAGHTLRVRYENPDKLDWGEYEIGPVICGGKSWSGQGTEITIPSAELPEGELAITVTLIPKRK